MIQTESKIQQEALIWFNNNYCLTKHNPRCIMFSVPNELGGEVGGLLKRLRVPTKAVNEVVGFIMRKMINIGLRRGASDTIIVLPSKTIYVEFKTPIGTQSSDQLEFENIITGLDQDYHLVRSVEEFKTVIEFHYPIIKTNQSTD